MVKQMIETDRQTRLRKSLYKVMLYLVKYLPICTAGSHYLANVLCCLDIDTSFLALITGMSITSIVFMYIASYIFGFCSYHRMYIHYVTVCDIVTYYDAQYKLPIEDVEYFILHTIIAIVFAILTYKRFKHDIKQTCRQSSNRGWNEDQKRYLCSYRRGCFGYC